MMGWLSRLLGRVDGFDAIAVAGLALLTWGLFLVYVPAALIVPGVLLLWFGVAGARRS